MAYATYAQYKAATGLKDAAETDRAIVERLLDAATRKFDRFCNRPDGFIADASASARYYHGSGLPYQWIDECASVTAVAVKDSPSDDEDSYTAWTLGTVGTTTDADVFPASGDPESPDFTVTPYQFLVVGANGSYSHFTSGSFTGCGGFRPTTTVSRGLPTVKVTAKWGYATTCPADIQEACVMQSARWYKRLRSDMADTLASGELGQMLYTMKLDPDIAGILCDGRYVIPALGRW
jgi:hypothetical protein